MEPEKETAITPETLKVVEENCRKITNETCVKLCIMKKLGVIDERGWYVESKGTEFIKSIFPTDVIIDNQESIFQQIAQTCNRVNKHVSNNCHRGEEVAKCLNEEMEKVLQNKDDGNEMEPEKETAITPETLKVVEENCRKITNETCVKLCIMKKLGVIDERGWYVESKGTEFIKSIFPTDVIIDNQESIFQQIAQTCNRVNKHVSNNCHRGEEVAKCLNEEMEKVLQNKDDGNEMEPEKETAITPETLKVVEENCRKITNETCVKLCIMKKLGVIDERGCK
ncbi:uncharacterized protein LOC134798978 [Cydia splendana]|uniref:uncharacterized protein LOC134798978 n=1 Tax=Cydia splendana TaxID=1100963 RepID=UPI00300CD05B